MVDHDSGGWRVYLTPPGGERVEVTEVRGVVTEIGELEDTDPFSWQDTTLTFAGLTIWDRLGEGELAWCAKDANVDIEWDGPIPEGYPYERFVYEGLGEDIQRTDDSVVVTVKGALRQQNNHKAKPEHAVQPLPYEFAIRRQWDLDRSLRVSKPDVVWPDWWATRYTPEARRNSAFIPTAVRPNEFWTGMTTRNTGNWEEGLDYIAALLGNMYTSRGRWTLDLLPGRRSVLVHRDYKTVVDDATIVINGPTIGVSFDLSEAWSASGNVWYGSGKSLQGVGYTGLEVSVDGRRTSYRPLAASRQVDPATDDNGWLQTERVRREVVLQALEGLDQAQAEAVGEFQHRHFCEPGLQGTVKLTADVVMANGQVLPKWLIRAGMTLHCPGLAGGDAFLLIVKVTRSFAEGSVTLTVDSKYRDALTIDQIREKGRDALAVPRSLIGGLYTPALEDQLVPWSYAEGSGFIPSGAGYSSLRLFDGMPDDVQFPWEEWTTERPPSSRSWRSCYIGIGPKSAVADDNWAFVAQRGGGRFGYPIRMAQAATIRGLQIAAYDFDGNVLAVPFHVSLYTSNGVNVDAMPKIPGPSAVDGYAVGQRYPFFAGAWERYGSDGVAISTEVTVPVQSAGFLKGWGTGRVKAGYSPGSSGSSHAPTGMLDDTEEFSIQAPTGDGNGDWGINPYSERQLSTYAGYLYLMVYCDAQAEQSVFFVGRFYRDEPGAGE